MKANTQANLKRCKWVTDDQIYIDYHDHEWGVPLHDEQRLFEMLILEGMQAGLSWLTVLKKRENYRKLFDGFDVNKVARYSQAKVEKLLLNPGIIRNRRKVEATVQNAKSFLSVQEEFDCFDQFIWKFIDGEPKQNQWRSFKQIPTQTKESEAMSKELKQRGFKFVGPTICHAYMQAVGMVNDHETNCFRYQLT